MMMGACLSKIKGARPFSVDLIEIIRRTLSNLFEMDSMNVSRTFSFADGSYEMSIFYMYHF